MNLAAQHWQDNFGFLEAVPAMAPTPAQRKARAAAFHAEMLVFNDEMAKIKTYPKGQEGKLAAWQQFRDLWAKWYGQSDDSTWTQGTVDATLDGYETELHGWYTWYADNIGNSPAAAASAASDAAQWNAAAAAAMPTSTWWYVVGAVGLGGLAYKAYKHFNGSKRLRLGR